MNYLYSFYSQKNPRKKQCSVVSIQTVCCNILGLKTDLSD